MEHNEIINMMHSNPSQSHIIAACQDKYVRLYTSDPFTLINTLEAHTAPVISAIFISDTNIVSADISGELILWRLEDNYTPYHRMKLNSTISMLANYQGNVLISLDDRIELFNSKTHETSLFYKAEEIIISLDCVGEYIVLCTENGTLINLKKNILVMSEKGAFKDAAVSESEGLVCIVAVGEKIVIFENEKRIEIEGTGDCVKWSSAGFCFVVGDANACRCYGPDSEGNFREISIEESK